MQLTRVLLALSVLTCPTLGLARGDADAPRREALLEYQHGHFFADPYRWMENPDDPQLRRWIAQQNQRLRSDLSGSLLAEVEADFHALYNPAPRMSNTNKSSAKSLRSLRKGSVRDSVIRTNLREQRHINQRFLYHPSEVPLVRPPASGIEYGNWMSPSGRYEVVLESDSYGDLTRLGIIDWEQSGDQEARLRDLLMVRFTGVFWEDDYSFLYTTRNTGRSGEPRCGLYRHYLGTRQSDDELLFSFDTPGSSFWLFKIDGEWYIDTLVDNMSGIGRFNMGTGDINYVLPPQAEVYDLFNLIDRKAYLVDFSGDPMGEVVEVDIDTGDRQVLVSQRELGNRVIDVRASPPVKLGDTYLVTVVEDTASRLVRVDTDDGAVTEIPLPAEGTAYVRDYGYIAVYIVGHATPFAMWTYDMVTDELLEAWSAPPLPLGAELEAERVFYTAHNGQDTPIWVVRSKGSELTPGTPMLLYGYGGFRVNIMPSVRNGYIPWYLRGGAAAFVTLPGGFEYGETWHEAGSQLNKTNVFADFEAAAERLIELGYTSPGKLAASGGSNGGLLVGAVVNRRPDLFGAAVPEVGVMDMVRFELFTVGGSWTAEYGSRFDGRSFRNLLSYSPYHNIRVGFRATDYPAIMVVTADLDDRVVPGHSFKYAARLMERSRSGRPVYLLTKEWSSHNNSSSLLESIEGEALKWTFLLQELGATP